MPWRDYDRTCSTTPADCVFLVCVSRYLPMELSALVEISLPRHHYLNVHRGKEEMTLSLFAI